MKIPGLGLGPLCFTIYTVPIGEIVRNTIISDIYNWTSLMNSTDRHRIFEQWVKNNIRENLTLALLLRHTTMRRNSNRKYAIALDFVHYSEGVPSAMHYGYVLYSSTFCCADIIPC